MSHLNPFETIEKFAKIGSVTVDKTMVTFSVKEGEGDDVFAFTLTGNKTTLGESVNQIVGYLLKASALLDRVFNELAPSTSATPTQTPEPSSSSPDKPIPTADRSDFLALPRASADPLSPKPTIPVFPKAEFLDKLYREEQGFDSSGDEGIVFDPNNFKE